MWLKCLWVLASLVGKSDFIFGVWEGLMWPKLTSKLLCTFIELQFLILLPPSPKCQGKFNPSFFLIFFMCIVLGWHPGPWTASPALSFPLRSFQLDSCHHNSAAVVCVTVASDFHIAKPRASSQPQLACLTNEHSSLIPLCSCPCYSLW